ERGRLDKSLICLQSTLTRLTQLLADQSQPPDFRRELGRSYLTLGDYYRRLHRFRDAERAYDQAHDVASQLVKDYPHSATFQVDAARALERSAIVAVRRSSLGECTQGLELILAEASGFPLQALSLLGQTHLALLDCRNKLREAVRLQKAAVA